MKSLFPICRPILAFAFLIAQTDRGLAAESSPTGFVEMKPRAGLNPFEYIESAPLPNYVPSTEWGKQGEPIRTMQKPLDPAESMKHLVTLPDFETSLFAAEPDILKPLWIAWDERGRTWIAETVDYPNELQPAGEGRDQLKILEDTNGDGRADKFTIFADKLSIPTGFVFVNGGVIVIHSGKTEFLRDTNNDGKADERKILFTGWGMGDTHATASNLRYGFDGWIWGVVGYSGFNGTVGGKEIRFGQGIFRFKPDGSALEYIRASNNNTWGLAITEDNIIIGSTANNNATMYLPMANRFYERVNGWSASRLESIADSQRIYPLTEKVRQVDWHERYTAGAGSAIYTARIFPKQFWNRAQFVAEPTGHLLGLFFLDARGGDFVAHNARNFAASDDEWTSPICAEVGPDGALWMIDWYNYIVQHNPTPRGFETGKGAAYETPLRDKTHGRIYRIVHTKSTPPSIDFASVGATRQRRPTELVAALKNDNLLWRMHAQRLLVERGDKDVVPALNELVRDQSVDEIGLNVAAIHALWTLQNLGAFDGTSAPEVVVNALKHPSAGVRRAAVSVLPRNESSLKAVLNSKLLDDADAQVRLAALLALSEMPPSDVAGAAVFAALQEPRNFKDRWIPDGATSAGARHDAGFVKTALTFNPSSETERVIRLVTAHYAQRGPTETIVSTLNALKDASPAMATTLLEGLISGWPRDKPPILDSADKQTLLALMQALPEDTRDRLLALAKRWGHPELFGTSIPAIIASVKEQITNASATDAKRAAAAKRLINLDNEPETLKFLLEQITLLTPPDLAIGFINALGSSREETPQQPPVGRDGNNNRARTSPTANAVMKQWAQFTPTVRRSAIALLMRRPEWAGTMLQAVEDGQISKTDLATEHWSQLKQHPNQFVARRAERLAERNTTIATGREEIVRRLLPLASEKGDVVRGKEVFTANCMACHVFNGEGKQLGPDLNGIGARDRADILMEILDPNRSVEANFRAWTVTTKDDESFTGRLESETQTTVEILDTTAQKHVIQRKDIASLTVSPNSIMPTGFEALPPDDLKSLLEYLATTKAHSGAQ